MRLNKKRKIVTREDLIKQFNKFYPYELIIEYVDEESGEVEWIDLFFEGNFDLTKEDIKKTLEESIRDNYYIVKNKKNKLYFKSKNNNKTITVVKKIFKR